MGKRIMDSAQLQPCSLRLYGCENDMSTVVFAHAPSVDKGTGIKTPNFFGAFACTHCHDVIDGRKDSPFMMEKEKWESWVRGIYETQKSLIGQGLMSYDDN